MKRMGLVLSCCFLFYIGSAQIVDLHELTGFLNLSQSRLEKHLQKKGFAKTDLFTSFQEAAPCYIFKNKKSHGDKNSQRFLILSSTNDNKLAYETTSSTNYTHLIEEIKNNGFGYCEKITDSTQPIIYQKQNITIVSSIQKNDSSVVYTLTAEKKELPERKDILSAEDLLKLGAQEYLITVFGKENVRTDYFYYTETDRAKCSVLFPNTNREAIFIWKDEQNLRDIAFIIIGGSLHSKENTDNLNQVSQNSWMSKQGVYCGMSLRDLELLNKEPIRFYNWRCESAGYLAPKNKGVIDFERLGIVFNCLNCSYVKLQNSDIVASNYALEENQKVYVTTLIILPQKKLSDVSHRK